jgi:hypothetical protein
MLLLLARLSGSNSDARTTRPDDEEWVKRTTSQQLSSMEGSGIVMIDPRVEKPEVCLDMLFFAFLPWSHSNDGEYG